MAKFDSRAAISVEFTGPLSEPIKKLVAEKRRIGYRFNSEAILLRELSRFAEEQFCPQNELTRNIVTLWNEKQATHSNKTHKTRCSVVHTLGEYMANHGYVAYVCAPISSGICEHGSFAPYIFSDDELTRFFHQVDKTRSNGHSPNQHLFYPLLFRLLYGCGLRLNEALRLQIKDVDLDAGILSIRGTKFDKDRLIPMHEALTVRFREYSTARLTGSDEKSLFFPAPDGSFYAESSVYYRYRLTLKNAGISYGGRGKGPRIHDFRHTFAIHCLRQWMRNGTVAENAIQRLSVYMGHVNTQCTHTYLRLTAELFPEIVRKTEIFAGDIVPTIEEATYEEDF